MATKETKLQIVVDAQNRTQGTFNALQNNLDGVKKSYHGLQNTLAGVGAAGTTALAGIGLLTKGAISAGAGFEQTQIAFTTMIGSAEKAQKTLNDLSQFAARTPFELTQLEEASKRLLAYGVTADDLIPTLRMLGDISAGVGMDKLPQLILAFGQVRAATKLTGMELRQFSEAGVPLLGTLADQLGVTEAQVLEMVSAGQIGFPAVQQALASLTGEGGRFFNLMEKQSTSLGGLWSNLKDQIALTARSIGTELMPYLKPLVEQLIEVAQAVGEWVKANPQLAAAILIAALALTALLAVLLPIALALPGLIMLWGLLTTVTLASLIPFGLVIAILAALGFALYNIYQIIQTVSEGWEDIWLGIKIIAADAANAVIGTVEGMINFIIDGVNTAIRAINKVIAAAQRVPGIGKLIPSINELDRAQLARVDTGTIAAEDLAGRSSVRASTPQVVVTGNTFLSEDVAERLGDLMLGKLKLSNAI